MNLFVVAALSLFGALVVAGAFIGTGRKRRQPHDPPPPPRHYGEKTFNLGDWNGN